LKSRASISHGDSDAVDSGGRSAGGDSVAVESIDKKPVKRKSRQQSSGTDIGQLLRGAYRQTVEEAVPDDLMDLLNRLE
jgi:hypothetical protein